MSVLSLPVKRKSPEDATKPSQQKRPCRRQIPAITNLPTDIITNIISRVKLPIKTILADGNKSCLGCSKNELKSVFSDAKFAQAQSEYPRTCIFSYDPRHNNQRRFCLIENDDNKKTLSMEIDMSFMEEVTGVANLDILTSCNGLLLLGLHAYDSSGDCQLWVANPLTKQFTSLPQPDELLGDRYYYALGFDETKSNKYKVVRFVCRHGNKGCPSQWSGEILTVGTQSWRKIDGCDQILKDGSLDEGPVDHKGSLHWVASVADKKVVILRLDVETEEFETVALPEDYGKLYCCLFGVLDDMLYVGAYEILDIFSDVTVWFFDKYGEWDSWKKVVQIKNIDLRRSWPMKLLEVNDDGEILTMLGRPMALFFYNPRTLELRKLRVIGSNKIMRGVVFRPDLRSLSMYE